MNRIYMRPTIYVLANEMEPLMNVSGVTSNKDIDYGGVDEEGEKTPTSNRHRQKWDDWEEVEDEE